MCNPFPLKHYREKGRTKSCFGCWIMVHSVPTTVVEAANLFADMEEEHPEKEFVALALHAVQQNGGKLLWKGNEIMADNFRQTSGNVDDLVGAVYLENKPEDLRNLFSDSA